MSKDIIPRPQTESPGFRNAAQAIKGLLPGLGLTSCRTVADLGCGRGSWVEIFLDKNVFSSVVAITAVDYHDLLPLPIKNNRRVVFRQGLLPNVLDTIPRHDLVVLANIETQSFTEEVGATKLAGLVENALVVVGDSNVNEGALSSSGLTQQKTRVPGLRIWKRG